MILWARTWVYRCLRINGKKVNFLPIILRHPLYKLLFAKRERRRKWLQQIEAMGDGGFLKTSVSIKPEVEHVFKGQRRNEKSQ
jgi:hypothetical protein